MHYYSKYQNCPFDIDCTMQLPLSCEFCLPFKKVVAEVNNMVTYIICVIIIMCRTQQDQN